MGRNYGAEDGKSNLVAEDVECFPQETNTFIPTSLTSKGCNVTKNIFSIDGDWENQEKLPTFSNDFKLRIDNANKDIADCRIEKENVKQLICSFEGEGDIKFEEQYFQGGVSAYKMKKTETSIHVDKCSGPDPRPGPEPDPKSNSNILFLNVFILSLTVLLLF